MDLLIHEAWNLGGRDARGIDVGGPLTRGLAPEPLLVQMVLVHQRLARRAVGISDMAAIGRDLVDIRGTLRGLSRPGESVRVGVGMAGGRTDAVVGAVLDVRLRVAHLLKVAADVLLVHVPELRRELVVGLGAGAVVLPGVLVQRVVVEGGNQGPVGVGLEASARSVGTGAAVPHHDLLHLDASAGLELLDGLARSLLNGLIDVVANDLVDSPRCRGVDASGPLRVHQRVHSLLLERPTNGCRVARIGGALDAAGRRLLRGREIGFGRRGHVGPARRATARSIRTASARRATVGRVEPTSSGARRSDAQGLLPASNRHQVLALLGDTLGPPFGGLKRAGAAPLEGARTDTQHTLEAFADAVVDDGAHGRVTKRAQTTLSTVDAVLHRIHARRGHEDPFGLAHGQDADADASSHARP